MREALISSHCAVGDDGTFEKHRDVVGHHENTLQVVRNDDGRAVEAFAQADDQIGQHVGDDRIEAGRRLVVEHAVRVRDHRARETGAFDHAAREFGREALADVRKPDALERLLDLRADLCFRELRVLAQRQRDVVEDRQRVEQRRELKRKPDRFPDPDQLALVKAGDVAVADQHAPFVGRSRPLSNRRIVDFPAPDKPMMHVIAPSTMSSERCCMTTFGP